MCKTIQKKIRFKSPPETVYPLLAKLTGITAAAAVGQRFSSGDAHGILVDLRFPNRIVQAWRTKDFGEGIYSMASLVLTPTPQGGTELKLTHRGVPKKLIPSVEARWRKRCWEKIRAATSSPAAPRG